ncbi:MAG: arginase [Euryarchaeota archaeon]|nr:arginase [Euryarchaeota archaeon]
MNVTIIGAPVDLGQQRRGVDMGPSAIRAAALNSQIKALGHKVEDAGNIFAPEKEQRSPRSKSARYQREIIDACEVLAKEVAKICQRDRFPVVLGGDHSIAMGSIAGVTQARGEHGLVWIDAHADFNTPETSPSGNIHGMPLAAVCGRGGTLAEIGGITPKVREEKVALVGIRDVDANEAELVNDSRITAFTMRDIDERGMRRVMEDALQVAGGSMKHVHASFDIDAVDPRWAPGSGTLVDGGLSYREAHLACEILSDSGLVKSLDMVEVNPLLDEGNKTGKLAAKLVASALGKSIL